MHLKRATFSAGRWTTVSAAMTTGIQLLQTVILARILLPGDFGLMAIVGAVIAVLSLMVDLGLSQALIHFDDVPASNRSSIYWLNIFLAIALALLLLAASPLFGRWYRSDQLVQLLRWVSLAFPLSAAGQQLRILAARDLRFHDLAVIDVAAAVAGLASAIAAASVGGGALALVIGMLVSAGTSSLLAWMRLPGSYRPRFHFKLRETRPYLGFGIYLVGESLANAVHRNSDVFAGGLVVRPASIGMYSVPRDLSMRASMVVNAIATKIGFPVMSRVKREPERLKSIYFQTLRMTASVNFPLYLAMGIFASEIVALLYGPNWKDAALYLRLLAAWGLVRSTGNPAGSLLYATGKIKQAFWWNIGLMVCLPVSYWIIVRTYGLPGLAVGVLALQLLTVVPAWYVLIRPCCNASLREYLSIFAAPLFCSIVAGGIVWLLTHCLAHGALRMAVGFAVGGLLYFALSWLFNRQWILAMLELLGLYKPKEFA